VNVRNDVMTSTIDKLLDPLAKRVRANETQMQ
jgi:hypothetical protein